MKTKKLLSFMLALTMVFSMMATLTVTAFAGRTPNIELKAGETFTFLFDEGVISSEDGENHYCNFVSGAPEKMTVTSAAQDGVEIKVTVKALAATTEPVYVYFDKYTAQGWQTSVREYNHPFVITAAPNECYLDLDSTTTDIPEKKDIDQNYNLTVTTLPSASGAVTKVKLSWEINDINATRTDNKVWDTTELKWVDDGTSATVIDQKGTAKFTLENYSSVKVNATASFKAEGDFKGTASYDVEGGKVTLDTANGNSTYSKNNVPTKVINATVTPAADDFKTLDATTKATKYGTYTVTISKYVATESIVLSNNTLDLNTNTNITATLTATVSPANATDSKVTWSSDNTAVATVDENGKVTAVGAGTATITATVGAKSTTCTVNVVAKIPVTNVSLNKTELTLTSNDYSNKTATLTATVTPDNATNKNVTWSSNNTAVATVDANGKVTAVDYAKGKAVITATADNVSTTCTVTVNCLPE